MRERKIIYSESDLASRLFAAVDRVYINNLISRDYNVTLDMTSVKCITNSYADELLGVLVKRLGIDVLSNKVRVIASDCILEQIAEAILVRDNGSKDCN